MANLRVLFNRVDQLNSFKEENEPDEEIFIEITDPDGGRA
jgi:hypothetical protein